MENRNKLIADLKAILERKEAEMESLEGKEGANFQDAMACAILEDEIEEARYALEQAESDQLELRELAVYLAEVMSDTTSGSLYKVLKSFLDAHNVILFNVKSRDGRASVDNLFAAEDGRFISVLKLGSACIKNGDLHISGIGVVRQ